MVKCTYYARTTSRAHTHSRAVSHARTCTHTDAHARIHAHRHEQMQAFIAKKGCSGLRDANSTHYRCVYFQWHNSTTTRDIMYVTYITVQKPTFLYKFWSIEERTSILSALHQPCFFVRRESDAGVDSPRSHSGPGCTATFFLWWSS